MLFILIFPFDLLGRWSFRTLSCNRFDLGPVAQPESGIIYFYRAAWSLPVAGYLFFCVVLQIYAFVATLCELRTSGVDGAQAVEAESTRFLLALLYLYGLMQMLSAMRHIDTPLMHVSSFAIGSRGVEGQCEWPGWCVKGGGAVAERLLL